MQLFYHVFMVIQFILFIIMINLLKNKCNVDLSVCVCVYIYNKPAYNTLMCPKSTNQYEFVWSTN